MAARRYPPDTPLEERLFSTAIVAPSGCWEWQGARRGAMGYSSIDNDGKTLSAHRVAYELTVGPIPEGKAILHECDNPPCINPAHLVLGTKASNNADKAAKGRSYRPRGEENAQAKLTAEAVEKIRALHSVERLSKTEIGRRFGVNRSQIARILSGKNWQAK